MSARFVIWGSELSPFALKLRALCDVHQLPYDWLPADGGTWRNLRLTRAVDTGKRRGTIRRAVDPSPLDEYPLVPYLITPDATILYDSSAIARWLDREHPNALGPTIPREPSVAFVATWIEEAFDEIGLYLVHHNRWVISAATNDAGMRLAREYRSTLPAGTRGLFAGWFARRQVRRLPYLFSVAPEGFRINGVPRSLTPPSRPGFPPTHALLDDLYAEVVDRLEAILVRQPYLLGERFTIADAGVYGQLAMNLKDPTAADRLRTRAPRTHAWLLEIAAARHVGSRGEPTITPALMPLLETLGNSFAPLMRLNANAHASALERGERRFNEAAFDRNRSLYDGELRGHPFRSVAKTFQVRVWRDLEAAWRALGSEERAELERYHPFGEHFG